MPAATPPAPTLEQLLNLADRAEHKGGLTAAEAARLRAGLQHYGQDTTDLVTELRRKIINLRATIRRAHAATTTAATAAPAADGPVDQGTRDALHRVTTLAQRWAYIPAKRAAGAAVLAAVTNRSTE